MQRIKLAARTGGDWHMLAPLSPSLACTGHGPHTHPPTWMSTFGQAALSAATFGMTLAWNACIAACRVWFYNVKADGNGGGDNSLYVRMCVCACVRECVCVGVWVVGRLVRRGARVPGAGLFAGTCPCAPARLRACIFRTSWHFGFPCNGNRAHGPRRKQTCRCASCALPCWAPLPLPHPHPTHTHKLAGPTHLASKAGRHRHAQHLAHAGGHARRAAARQGAERRAGMCELCGTSAKS